MSFVNVSNLSRTFGAVHAVRDISFGFETGEIFGFIGPNGAGKTTMLAAIMGLLPAKGAVTYQGRDLAKSSVEQRVADGLTLVPEKRELFGELAGLGSPAAGVAELAVPVVVAGGVGANQRLRATLDAAAVRAGFEVTYPPPELCTDNGAMIALAAALRLKAGLAPMPADHAFTVRPRWDLGALAAGT